MQLKKECGQQAVQQRVRFGISLLACSLATVLYAGNASAAFVMVLDDPNDAFAAITIYDGGVGDSAAVAGVISYSGSVGAFSVNVTTGISKPLIGPERLDLNSINVSGAAGTINLAISDTDFLGTDASFLASYGGTTDGSVSFDFLYGAANAELLGDSFASDGFTSSPGNLAFSNDIVGGVAAVSPHSLTIAASITHTVQGRLPASMLG
jgi:hypothetical protein